MNLTFAKFFFAFNPANRLPLESLVSSVKGRPFFRGSWETKTPNAAFANSHMIISRNPSKKNRPIKSATWVGRCVGFEDFGKVKMVLATTKLHFHAIRRTKRAYNIGPRIDIRAMRPTDVCIIRGNFCFSKRSAVEMF